MWHGGGGAAPPADGDDDANGVDVATNVRMRDVEEGDVIEVDGVRASVSCAMILDDDVLLILEYPDGTERTLADTRQPAVRLIARPVADTVTGAASSLTNPR